MKTIDMVAIGTIAMFACLLFCTPALANYNFDGYPVETRASGTVNGGVFIDYVPWDGQRTLIGNFNVPNGNIAWARLYTGIWGGRPEYEGLVNVTFNGVDDTNELGPIHLQGQNDANPNVWCSGNGKYWMYYDVTGLVSAGEVNTATTTKINTTAGDFDGRVYGIVLVVVYEDGDDPKNIQYWINDGSDGLNYITQNNDGTTNFAGSVAGSVTKAELMMVHLTAYEPGCADCLQFNENVLDTSMITSNTFALNSWDVTGDVESSGNDAWYSRGDDGYVNVCNAILTLESEELPDLVVEKSVEFNEDGKFVVSYTVTNIGGSEAGESTACKYVDSVLQETQLCPALASDASHSDAFAPEECPCGETLNVTVCADNDDVVDESDEANNCEVNFMDCPPCKPDLIVTDINAYHYNTNTPPWFNMQNVIDVTVKNNGSAAAGASTVCLYIDDVSFGDLPMSSLDVDEEETVTFTGWNPSGDDCLLPTCVFDWSYRDYDLKGVADCDGDVAESNETNNERTVAERVCYNGYMADEPLENVARGTLHGHILFTTGDGSYGCLNLPGDTQATSYDITLPASATVEHAQLNVYYTWVSPDHDCPEMEVSITNPTGTHVLSLEEAYNDIKCTCPGTMYVKSWGNYVFDITSHVTGSGTYMVTVKNVGSSGHSFCLAAPGIVFVYEDENAPLIEYWVNKGADVLLCGRRSDGGYLAWQECINNATFPASTTTDTVETATLGVVAPWGDSVADDVLYFNDVQLGIGVYHGYGEMYYESIDSMTMEIGSTNAQVGVDVTDVTELYLAGCDNVVGQADDGDNMMPANAFLVVAYGEQKPDLVITDKWLCWPENCTICYSVTNIGDGTAPACHNTALYVDDVEVAHDHVPVDLAPGESYTGCFNGYEWGYTPPSDEIRVCADSNEALSELDEDNNCLTNIWMCGDVNCDGKVTMSDVRKVFNRYLDSSYPLDLPWAADVNGDGKVTMSDVRKVFNRYLDQGYDLNCCCDGVG